MTMKIERPDLVVPYRKSSRREKIQSCIIHVILLVIVLILVYTSIKNVL